MPDTLAWKQAFQSEIQSAQAARASGNEGRARVCARRAAGIAISAYFLRQGIAFRDPSAIARLKYLAQQPGLSARARSAAELLQVHVTTSYTLPVDADLIAEAQLLAKELHSP